MRKWLLGWALLLWAMSTNAQAQWAWAKQLPLEGTAVTGGRAGGCYISGWFAGTKVIGGVSFTAVGETDAFVGSFAADGSLQWGRTLGGPGPVLGGGPSRVKAVDISSDTHGNCYVTGTFEGTIANIPGGTLTATWGWNSLFTARISSTGTVQWMRKGGSTSFFSKAGAITVDASGNSYVTGVSSYKLEFDTISRNGSLKYQIFVASYSPAGGIRWLTTTTSSSVNNMAQDIAVDDQGGVYFTGLYYYELTIGGVVLPANGVGNPPTYYANMVLAKLRTSTGRVMWARWAGGNGASAAGEEVAVDAAGNCYVSGRTLGTAAFGNLTVNSAGVRSNYAARYSSTGTPLWAVRLDASTNEGRNRMAASADGSRVYVFLDRASLSPTPVALRRLRPTDGTTLWRLDMRGDARPFGLAISPAGELFAAGTFTGTPNFGGHYLTSTGGADFVTKIDEPAPRLAATSDAAPPLLAADAWSVYPNPTQSWATVVLPAGQAVRATIRDAYGRQWLSTSLRPSASGNARLDIRELPAGPYVLELHSENVSVKRLRLQIER